MKKLIYRILTFVPVALAGYVLLLWLLGDWGWVRTAHTTLGNKGHLCSRIKDIRNYHDVDVLFLGSSHCYRTFDTRTYEAAGYSCFNLGSSSQTPIQTEVLLQTYLDSLNPRYVVFEVHPDIMKNDGVESAVDLLANAPLTCASTRMAWKINNMKVLNTWLYAIYNQKLCHRLEHFVEDSVIENSAYVPGGYVETISRRFEVKRYPRTNLTIRPEQMEALKRCLDMLKERDIPYLLVEVQDAEQLRKSFLNHDWFEAQMSALGPYRYKILPMVDTLHFANSNHLYKPGIVMFNDDLLPDLEQLLPLKY
jgi:hypothetical protein